MARERKKKQMYVRLNRNGKSLNINTVASLHLESYDEVNIFEMDSVVAIQAVVQGDYHISREAGRPRKTLSNEQLVDYICKKFNCKLGESLPIWTGVQDGVVFFGKLQPESAQASFLDERFTAVKLAYNRRAGNWSYIHDNWIEFSQEIRAVLPKRMSAYRCGHVVMLSGDPVGKLALIPKRRSENLMLVSRPLADYLRNLYGGKETGMRLRVALVPGGVALADSLDALTATNVTRVEQIALDESQYCFITVGSKNTIYLSALAWESIGRLRHVSAWEQEGCLALKADKEGTFNLTKSGYAHYLHSVALSGLIKEKWPGTNRLYLLKYEDLWLLWPSPVRPAMLPSPATFRRIELYGRQVKRGYTDTNNASNKGNTLPIGL